VEGIKPEVRPDLGKAHLELLVVLLIRHNFSRPMPIVFLSAHQFSGAVLALFQAASNMGEGGVMAMMVACVLFGLVLFIVLVELVILEFLWIKLWRRRLRNESRAVPAISGRAA